MKNDSEKKPEANKATSSPAARKLMTEVLLAGAILDKDHALERKMKRRKKAEGR